MTYPIGRAIRAVRMHRNLTQSQVAHRMGTVRPYITKIETAVCQPSMESFIRIADALEIEPYKLLRFAMKQELSGEQS